MGKVTRIWAHDLSLSTMLNQVKLPIQVRGVLKSINLITLYQLFRSKWQFIFFFLEVCGNLSPFNYINANFQKISDAYPNMRSIHSCKCSETCSLSRAIRCFWMKSTGFLAQGGSLTVSERGRKRVRKTYQQSIATHFLMVSSWFYSNSCPSDYQAFLLIVLCQSQ